VDCKQPEWLRIRKLVFVELAQRLFAESKGFKAGTPIDAIVNCTGVDNGTIVSFAVLE